MINEVTASREGGNPVIVKDTALQTTQGVLTATNDLDGLLVATDAQVRNIAESVLLRYKTPRTRVDGWSVRPGKNTANWPTVLNLELGHRVTLSRLPVKITPAISKDFVIESIKWDVTPGDSVVSFTASPVDGNSYFVWGTSNWDGTDVWR